MHPIENILNITMSELKEMADVDTIVGKPFVTPNGQTIVPISKISFGFVGGGGEYQSAQKPELKLSAHEYPFAGGTGAGISISPIAFMVSGEEELRLMSVADRTIADKILEQLPELARELRKMIGKKEEETGGKKEKKQKDPMDL